MRLFVMAKSLVSPVLQVDMIERYKWISIKYDQLRDNLFEKVYFDLLGVDKALYSQVEETINIELKLEIEERKDEIRWDIAW